MNDTHTELLDIDLHGSIFKDNSGRLRLVNIGLLAVMISIGIDAIVTLLYFKFIGGELYDYESMETYQMLYGIDSVIKALSSLFFGIAFIAWLFRAYKNLAFSNQTTTYPFWQSIYS